MNIGIALRLTAGLALGAMLAPPVFAQTSNAPPPLPATARTPAKSQPSGAPRRSIELTPAQRQAIDAKAEQAVKPQSIEESLVPTDEDADAPRSDENRTRIEQTRTSNRVSEVTVTPANSSRSYFMINREGRMPLGTTEMSSGLSVPQFFRFEFGRPTPPAAAAPPPAAPAAK
jgi:Spy/CpxP family protein refolding chaperone